MKHEPYQGWWNVQTWCVWLTWSATQVHYKRALAIVRNNLDHPLVAQAKLRTLATSMVEEIWNTVDWAWRDGESLTADVNWTEIFEHLRLVVLEERENRV